MTFYTTPNIPTDPNEMPQLVPEPIANSLQKEMQAVIAIEAPPIYMHVPGIEYPGVPRDYGWHMHQIDWPNQPWQGYPLQAPNISYATNSFTQSVQQAANPIPTSGATGFTVPLRAPGINEGV